MILRSKIQSSNYKQKKEGGNPEKDYDSAVSKAAQTKKSQIPYWGKNRGKVTSFCSDQSFSPTNTFKRLCSNLINTFSPIKYLLLRRDYNSNNTIILHYLAIIRRKSTRGVVALHFWSKILEINSYRVLQSSFPVKVQVFISQVTKKKK